LPFFLTEEDVLSLDRQVFMFFLWIFLTINAPVLEIWRVIGCALDNLEAKKVLGPSKSLDFLQGTILNPSNGPS
jgi:hypothetical protein